MREAEVLTVGLTGGVASGKSTVGRVWSTLGVPFYEADRWAIWLMESSQEIVGHIKRLLGANAYTSDGRLNRAYMAELIFNNDELRREVEQIVHPAVRRHFWEWARAQQAPYVVLESAIIFETGLHKELDLVVDVYAPVELRLARLSREGLLAGRQRMRVQLDENFKTLHADFVILNDGRSPLLPQIYFIHRILLRVCGSRGAGLQ